MSAKYTPGPWTAERHGSVTAVVDGRSVQVAAAMGQGPMYGPPETDVVSIQHANAHLIAAAPELLEACKHAVRYLAARGLYDTADVAAPILSAIAKAEGSR